MKQNLIIYAAQVSIWSHDTITTKVSAYSVDAMEVLDQLLLGPYQKQVIERVLELQREFDANS